MVHDLTIQHKDDTLRVTFLQDTSIGGSAGHLSQVWTCGCLHLESYVTSTTQHGQSLVSPSLAKTTARWLLQ